MESNFESVGSRELKYLFPTHAKKSLLTSLAFKCNQDKLYQSNNIHSLYFDTDDFQFAMEKAASDYYKSKIRIRWYETQDNIKATKCWLEIKSKLGSTRNKHRIPMPGKLEDVHKQLRSSATFENESMNFIRRQIRIYHPELSMANIKPVFTISYRRHRFYDPFSNSRIACDSDIGAKVYSMDPKFSAPQTKLNALVLEVKSKHETLPATLRSLSGLGFKKTAFSKYYQCFTELTGYEQ